jgi:Tol biopolymer transport system component
MDLWLLSLAGDSKTAPLAQTEFEEGHARFSPDSRWVAYASNESGRYEIYVQSVIANASGQRGKWRVSNSGGMEPKWRHDGKELFYMAPDRTLMAVEVNSTKAFEAGIPKALFRSCGYSFAYPFSNTYDTAANGRFLINCLVEETASSPVTVVVNWTAGLKDSR